MRQKILAGSAALLLALGLNGNASAATRRQQRSNWRS
jgi:hypothetical protein